MSMILLCPNSLIPAASMYVLLKLSLSSCVSIPTFANMAIPPLVHCCCIYMILVLGIHVVLVVFVLCGSRSLVCL